MLILVGGYGKSPFVFLASKGITGAVEDSLKVQDHVFQCIQFKTDEGFACNPLVEIRRNIEGEVINHVTDSCFSMVGKFFGDALG